jgi:hypothetical protein
MFRFNVQKVRRGVLCEGEPVGNGSGSTISAGLGGVGPGVSPAWGSAAFDEGLYFTVAYTVSSRRGESLARSLIKAKLCTYLDVLL